MIARGKHLLFIIGLLVSYLITFLIRVSIGGEAFVGVTILFLSAIIAGEEKDELVIIRV